MERDLKDKTTESQSRRDLVDGRMPRKFSKGAECVINTGHSLAQPWKAIQILEGENSTTSRDESDQYSRASSIAPMA